MKMHWLLIGCISLVVEANAAVDPVTVRLPMTTGWTGQRIPIFVELRATGSFAGTAAFELPQLAGALVIKIGPPVVGSEEIDGESWLVQSHEFALFVQRPGPLEVPPFTVRFAHHEGFTGPVKEVQAPVPGARVEIKLPPGTEPSGFFPTTASFTVRESWEPKPGPVQVGAMIKRTIVQQAVNVSGMALVPAQATAPEGLRLYPGTAETRDSIDRGELVGERRETLTYLVTHPGTRTLPALTYSWWNPKTEQLQSKTLDAVTFDSAPAASTRTRAATDRSPSFRYWLLAAAAICAPALHQRRRVARWVRRWLAWLFPPDEMAVRRLLAACRRNDATAAEAARFSWLQTKGSGFRTDPELKVAIQGLHRHLYGSGAPNPWQGEELRRAVKKQLATKRTRSVGTPRSALPALNP